jgi:hypothetical protein
VFSSSVIFTRLGSRKHAPIALGAIAVTIVVLAALAPPERVLGTGIRAVYLHVAATWAGLVGLYLAGLLGFVLCLRPMRMLETWLRSVGWVSLGLFGFGFVLSLLAAQVTWGGVLWVEPRVAVSLQVVALWIIVQVALMLPWSIRGKGALWVGLAAFSGWALRTSQLVLHPEQPIRESTSLSIQTSFFALFVLMVVAGAIAVPMVHRGLDAEGAQARPGS